MKEKIHSVMLKTIRRCESQNSLLGYRGFLVSQMRLNQAEVQVVNKAR